MYQDWVNDQQVLFAARKVTTDEFLESMTNSNTLVDHEDNCGMCEHQRIMAQVAHELIALKKTGFVFDDVKVWAEETNRRWNETKYVKTWREAEAAGLDPHQVFEELGWEA